MASVAVLTAGTVMDSVAALMNDSAKQQYTYVIQLPYLNRALQELQEIFELNEVPVADTITSSPITIPAGTTQIIYDGSGVPKLPDDLIEPQVLWERPYNTDPYTKMNRVDYLDQALAGVEINQFISYVWDAQKITFFPANQINQIKIVYIRALFTPATSSSSAINVVNAESYLSFRTAGLCSEFVGENKTRADSLNSDASLAMDRVIGIGSKGRQLIMTRRRPFRSCYKQRTFI